MGYDHHLAHTQYRPGQVGRVRITVPTVLGPIIDLEANDGLRHHLRIHHAADDANLSLWLAAAVEELNAPNGWLGRSLLTQTLELALDRAPPHTIRLPGAPIQSITSVEYRDGDNVFQTIDPSEYLTDVNAEPGLLWPVCNWPAMKGGNDTFRVTYVAGYKSVAAVPAMVKAWLKLRVGDYYRDRETVSLVSGGTLPQYMHILTNLRLSALNDY